MDEIRYRTDHDKRKIGSVKLRTMIIRRALDQYVHHRLEIDYHDPLVEGKFSRRLTAEDKSNYEAVELPCPPSRMNNEYYRRVFSDKNFCAYFRKYIEEKRLESDLNKLQNHQIREYEDSLTLITSKCKSGDSP